MVALNFNATQVKPQTALEPVPSGQYPVIITKTEEKPTRTGTGSFLEVEMTIQNNSDPSLNGRKVYDRLNLKNTNQQAVDIAYSTLSAICHVTGQLQLQHTEQLHGKPFIVVVIKKKREDQPELFSNEVKGYKDINGNDPASAQTGNHAPAQPAQGQPNWATQGAPAPVQQQQAPQPVQQPVQQQIVPQAQQQVQQQPGWAQPQTMPDPNAPVAAQQPQAQQQTYTGPPAGPAGAAPGAPPWAR